MKLFNNIRNHVMTQVTTPTNKDVSLTPIQKFDRIISKIADRIFAKLSRAYRDERNSTKLSLNMKATVATTETPPTPKTDSVDSKFPRTSPLSSIKPDTILAAHRKIHSNGPKMPTDHLPQLDVHDTPALLREMSEEKLLQAFGNIDPDVLGPNAADRKAEATLINDLVNQEGDIQVGALAAFLLRMPELYREEVKEHGLVEGSKNFITFLKRVFPGSNEEEVQEMMDVISETANKEAEHSSKGNESLPQPVANSDSAVPGTASDMIEKKTNE